MRYYMVADDKRKFKKLDNARKRAIEIGRNNKYYSKANVSVPIWNEKNESVGEVYVGDSRMPYPEWVTHYWKFSEHTGRTMMMNKRWILNKDGSLGKKVMG